MLPNWLGLMKGNLEIEMVKNGKKFIRKLNKDRNYISPEGKRYQIARSSFTFK